MSFNHNQPRDAKGRWVAGPIGPARISRKFAAAPYGPKQPRTRPAWPQPKRDQHYNGSTVHRAIKSHVGKGDPGTSHYKPGLKWMPSQKSFRRSVRRDKPLGVVEYINVN